MTLDQLAHLLDQLKRPIEEAPRDGTWIIGLFPIDACAVKWEEYEEGEYMWCTQEGFCNPTHFLPLPKPGPVEFEVVPKGTVEVLSRMCEVIHSGRCATRGGELWSLADKVKVILGGKD